MNYDNYHDAPVFDREGDKVGTIAEMYYTDQSDQPVWATIKSGLFGVRKHFIPLTDAIETKDGIVLPDIDEAMIKDAPSIEHEDELSDDDAVRLSNYYRYQDEKENGREYDTEASEPMPHVEFEANSSDSLPIPPKRQTLHRYIVREGGKKWQEEVYIERTAIED